MLASAVVDIPEKYQCQMMFPNAQSITEEGLWHLWPGCFLFLEKKSFCCLSAASRLWTAGAAATAAGGRGEQGAVAGTSSTHCCLPLAADFPLLA